MNASEVWWQEVPSARRFVKSVARNIVDNHNSLQISLDYKPWKQQFVDDVTDYVQGCGSDIAVRDIDGDRLRSYLKLLDGIADITGIGRNYDGSLSSLRGSLPDGGCVFRLNGLNESQRAQAYSLAAEAGQLFQKEHFPCFSLIFEGNTRMKRKYIVNVEEEAFELTNICYFAYLLLESEQPGCMLDYAIALALEISEGRIESCADICERINKLGIENPLQLAPNRSDIVHAVHRAQIRCFEPLIQLGRLQLCGKLQTRIKGILPLTDDYGQKIKNPGELELRHLWHYADNLSLNDEEFDRLRLLYNARNNLSHQKLMDYETVQSLINRE